MTIDRDDVVLDVGANLGAFSIVAAILTKNGIVYAFEPLKENTDYFERNMCLNNIQNVNLIQKAISDRVGRVDFFLDAVSPASSSLLTVELQRTGNQTVECTTIDDFVKS